MVNKTFDIRKKNKSMPSILIMSVISVRESLVRDLSITINGMMVLNLITRLINMPILNMFLNRLKIIQSSFYYYASHITTLWNGPKKYQMISLRDFLRQGE